MRIPLWSVCSVLAFAIGCVGEDPLFLPGELPDFWAAGASDKDCHLEVDGSSSVGDRDTRAAIPVFTGMPGRIGAGVGASLERLGFTTASCEVKATE